MDYIHFFIVVSIFYIAQKKIEIIFCLVELDINSN